MHANEIIGEIHRHREALAREYDFDVKKLMAHYRRKETEHEAAGRKLVSFVAETSDNTSYALHEDPPPP
jgi:hypothetical protein